MIIEKEKSMEWLEDQTEEITQKPNKRKKLQEIKETSGKPTNNRRT